MKRPKCPAVPKGLLRWLEETYPDRLPTEPLTERDLAEKVGEQNVIRRLRHAYETQNY